MDSFKFKIILQEKISKKNINNISDENVSFLVKKSILRLFGELSLQKFYFEINKLDNEENTFTISYLSDFKKKLTTALLLLTDLEYNIRVIIYR